jgi:trigger factor
MQVTETLSEGLKREYQVLVPQADLDAKVEERLSELKDQVRINGFRPGKVPVAHLRRLYGRSVRAEAIEGAVREANASIIADKGLTLAMEPKVTMPTEEGAVQALVDGKTDLAFSVAMEILPKIELGDFQDIRVERLTAEVEEAEIDEAVNRIAEQNRPFATRGEGGKAEQGDRVTVSFQGTIEGNPFEGGSGDAVVVEIGSKTFLPGFEEQLIGIAAGETRTVTATFPEGYVNRDLAGKEASFEVTAKGVDAPGTVAVNDEFANVLGLESLAKLRELVKDRLAREHTTVSRRRLKRQLLDALDTRYQFELPPTMVEEEFANIWRTVEADLQAQSRTFAEEGTTEEQARAEYRKIAERRVRLGLVVAEIGGRNNIKVTDEEMNRTVMEQARQFPGQERELWEYYRKNPNAVAALRAPIFEDKVVDFLLELVKVDDKTVSKEVLFKEDEGTATAA